MRRESAPGAVGRVSDLLNSEAVALSVVALHGNLSEDPTLREGLDRVLVESLHRGHLDAEVVILLREGDELGDLIEDCPVGEQEGVAIGERVRELEQAVEGVRVEPRLDDLALLVVIGHSSLGGRASGAP